MRTKARVLLALCSIHPLFFVLQVSLTEGPGGVGLFAYVFNVCSSGWFCGWLLLSTSI